MDIHCRRATELISASMDRRLTLSERTCLALHLMICTACRAYRRQMRVLRDALRCDGRGVLDHAVDADAPSLPDDARRRIQAALDARE